MIGISNPWKSGRLLRNIQFHDSFPFTLYWAEVISYLIETLNLSLDNSWIHSPKMSVWYEINSEDFDKDEHSHLNWFICSSDTPRMSAKMIQVTTSLQGGVVRDPK